MLKQRPVSLIDWDSRYVGDQRITGAPCSPLWLVAFALLLAGCLRVESYNNPTLPVPQWHLYSDIEVGYALALPEKWAAFDLDRQIDLAAEKCSSNRQLREARVRLLTDLHARSVRFFACDSGRESDVDLPIAYAARASALSGSIDAYLDGLPQAPGRKLVDRHHSPTNAGDMVIQEVRQHVTRPDGTTHDTTQLQFLVVRFDALHLLLVEFPSEIEGTYARNAELFGTSFTPLR